VVLPLDTEKARLSTKCCVLQNVMISADGVSFCDHVHLQYSLANVNNGEMIVGFDDKKADKRQMGW
jgi:hypothetical protein